MDVRKLQLGDFLWIAKEKFGKSMKGDLRKQKKSDIGYSWFPIPGRNFHYLPNFIFIFRLLKKNKYRHLE